MLAYFNLKNLKMIKIGDDKYMDIEEYATSKSKTVQTIYNWIKDKKVTTRKFMGKILIKL